MKESVSGFDRFKNRIQELEYGSIWIRLSHNSQINNQYVFFLVLKIFVNLSRVKKCSNIRYFKVSVHCLRNYDSKHYFFLFKVDTWHPSQGVCQEEVQGRPPHCLGRYSLLQRALDHPAPYISFRHHDSYTKVKLNYKRNV